MESPLIPKKIRLDNKEAGDLQTCTHYVKRKKRFCKMLVAAGKSYCGEHEPITNYENANDDDGCRIACPLDPKHTIYKKNLEKHLKICNSKIKDNLPSFIKLGVNNGSSDEETNDNLMLNSKDQSKSISLKEISEQQLEKLIGKIAKIYQNYVHNTIEEQILKHDILSEELLQPNYGKDTIKHLSQTASILGYLEKLNFLKNESAFIEFGAGKGQVSYWLAKLIETRPNISKTQVILIDRASLRHKKDNKLENRTAVHRIRADISDIVLEELEHLKDMKHVVAIGKHLCGAATDLMLRSLLHHNSKQDICLIVSLCCHHRCTWKTFVGKDFLILNDINQDEFNIMTKMVSWGICGTGMSRERRNQINFDENVTNLNKISKLKISRERKEEVGQMCKRVLDYARLTYMNKKGYECFLKYYIEKEITLENVCMVGKRKSSGSFLK